MTTVNFSDTFSICHLLFKISTKENLRRELLASPNSGGHSGDYHRTAGGAEWAISYPLPSLTSARLADERQSQQDFRARHGNDAEEQITNSL